MPRPDLTVADAGWSLPCPILTPLSDAVTGLAVKVANLVRPAVYLAYGAPDGHFSTALVSRV